MKQPLDNQPVNTRIKIVGLWTAMLFVFAYVDIFGFFRKDIIQGALNGTVGSFDAGQGFLIFTTVYILIPSIALFLTLILKPSVARVINIVLAALYILTIIGATIGETWIYYIMGSVTEIILLIGVIIYAAKWPRISAK